MRQMIKDFLVTLHNYILLKRNPCIKQTFWPPKLARKSKCSNRMTFIENVLLNNYSLGFGSYFSWWPTFGLKIDFKFDETSENMSFSAFLTTSNTCLYRAQLKTKIYIDILVCYSPWQNLHPISISFWYLNVLYTSQVLEVVRNGKNIIFLLILLNLSSHKSPFTQYQPKSVPNPDILIILLPKNDTIVVLAKILFLTIFTILAM